MGVSSIFGLQRAGGPGQWRFTAAAALSIVVMGGALATHVAPVLINTTPSEPPGLYLKTGGDPDRGRIVAFPAPPAAFPYPDRRLAYLHRTPLLKTVAAGPGDQVCTRNGQLAIDGQVRGPVAQTDRQGVALPHWNGCRRLALDELFVFSDRVPNSFDSRYFGPIHRGAILGVYAPLVVLASGGR